MTKLQFRMRIGIITDNLGFLLFKTICIDFYRLMKLGIGYWRSGIGENYEW
ncbi:MAG: hypothetical protein HXY43_19820 [Fischerella sp.]|uniref:hypothetical protein n=1 Tax=Fischerella sp. TaxID=1191 RepID=UPI0017E83374|nr:hypothetical protein [Fischerella sp.]NWF61433.1 hypothetical protein [Fischerella sp.]